MSAITLLTVAWRIKGFKVITRGVVEQFGIDTIPLWARRSSAFTSGTTNGTDLSILKAELSSMATAPFLAAIGAISLLTSPLADINAPGIGR